MSRALVVDDTQLGRHALSEKLKSAGFEVHAFGDAYDAIAAVPSVEPSVRRARSASFWRERGRSAGGAPPPGAGIASSA